MLVTQDVSRQDSPTDMYIETDQRKWHTEKAVSKDDKGVFGFESAYEKAGRQEVSKTGWVCKRYGNTPMEISVGGNRNTYVTAFNDNNN